MVERDLFCQGIIKTVGKIRVSVKRNKNCLVLLCYTVYALYAPNTCAWYH